MIKNFQNDIVASPFSTKIHKLFEDDSYFNDNVCAIAWEKKDINGKVTK